MSLSLSLSLSNGWDDTTAALQLLFHLEGDVLNVALLVPEARRATRTGLVGALTEHYGAPGRLADYRSQFEKTARKEGEDPSSFAIALETLAVKAFGDMGHTAQLRLIHVCDQFIAGFDSCALRRHLDSVSPETPILDIIDRCWCGRATLTPRPGGLANRARRELCRSILWTSRDVGWTIGCWWQSLFPRRRRIRWTFSLSLDGGADTKAHSASQVWNYWLGDFAAGPATRDSSSGPAGATGSYTSGLGYDSMLFLWQGGTWSRPMSRTVREVPV